MPYIRIPIVLKDAPELRRLILAADPTYRKRTASLRVEKSIELSGTYWSGGTISTYTAVHLSTLKAGAAPQYDPPGFGGPAEPPKVSIPREACIVETGFFCGKVREAYVYMHPDAVTRLIPNFKESDHA